MLDGIRVVMFGMTQNTHRRIDVGLPQEDDRPEVYVVAIVNGVSGMTGCASYVFFFVEREYVCGYFHPFGWRLTGDMIIRRPDLTSRVHNRAVMTRKTHIRRGGLAVFVG